MTRQATCQFCTARHRASAGAGITTFLLKCLPAIRASIQCFKYFQTTMNFCNPVQMTMNFAFKMFRSCSLAAKKCMVPGSQQKKCMSGFCWSFHGHKLGATKNFWTNQPPSIGEFADVFMNKNRGRIQMTWKTPLIIHCICMLRLASTNMPNIFPLDFLVCEQDSNHWAFMIYISILNRAFKPTNITEGHKFSILNKSSLLKLLFTMRNLLSLNMKQLLYVPSGLACWQIEHLVLWFSHVHFPKGNALEWDDSRFYRSFPHSLQY